MVKDQHATSAKSGQFGCVINFECVRKKSLQGSSVAKIDTFLWLALHCLPHTAASFVRTNNEELLTESEKCIVHVQKEFSVHLRV